MAVNVFILLEKNLMTGSRKWRGNIVEVCIIFILLAIIVANPLGRDLDFSVDEESLKLTKYYKASSLTNLTQFIEILNLKPKLRYKLVYTPNISYAKEIVNYVTTELQMGDPEAYETEAELEARFNKKFHFAGIIFPKPKKDKIPHKFKVILRFPASFRTIKTNYDEDKFWVTRCSSILTTDGEDESKQIQTDLYLREGFLQLQNLIYQKWFEMIKAEANIQSEPTSSGSLMARSFRQSTDKKTCYKMNQSNLTTFLGYFVFMLSFLSIVWKYGREIEENIFVHHWKYGFEFKIHWLAHFAVSFSYFLILIVITILFFKIQWTESSLFLDISPFTFGLFLALYSTALILTAMVVASMFNRAKHAVLCGIALWLSTYALFSTTLYRFSGVKSYVVYLCIIIFFNNAFPYGIQRMKYIDKGMDQTEIWYLIITLLIAILKEIIILTLIQYCWPGRYMHSLIAYAKKKKVKKVKPKVIITLNEKSPSWHNFEYGPIGGSELLRLRNICTFLDSKRKKPALKNISMRIYKGEITVILGHHGSGKSTLISILAGWKKPEVGSIKLRDSKTDDNWENLRRYVDVCMPNNALFDYLTAIETLEYFIRIKCPEKDDERIRMEVTKWWMITRKVINRKSLLVVAMTFEQKRVLCICCALACDTRVVLLDEPTLHMRSTEQRAVWSMLQQEKPESAIVITTFSVNEAELIGDRIAVLTDGVLKAYGTPFFLKSKYGVGYDLLIIKQPEQDAEPITVFISDYIPNIRPENEVGDQLLYKIPRNKRPIYQNLLVHLEKERTRLGIDGIRMVGSELGEIYMTLGARKNNQILDSTKTTDKDKRPIIYLSKGQIKRQQISALFYKKIILQAPSLIPLFMILVSFLLILLVGELSKVLNVPPERHQAIHLGMNYNGTERNLINQCKLTLIKQVTETSSDKKSNHVSRIFSPNSFACGNDEFEKFVNHDKALSSRMGAVENKTGNFTVWINQRIFHTAPLALNLLHNLQLQEAFPNDNTIFTTIENNPMPIPLLAQINLLDQEMVHLQVPLTVGIIIPITISTFILNLVDERRQHMLLIQRMAGLRMHLYWFVTLLCDLLTFFAYTFVFLIVMALSNVAGFGFFSKILLQLLLTVYGFAALAMTYLIFILYDGSRLSTYFVSVIVQLITGICSYVLYWDVFENHYIFRYAMAVFPTFSLLDGTSNIYTANKEQEYCDLRCKRVDNCTDLNMCEKVPQCCFDTFFKWQDPGLLPAMTAMFLAGVIFLLLIFVITVWRKEHQFSSSRGLKHLRTATYPYDDDDVVDVKTSIAQADMRECRQVRVVVDQLEHHIPRKGNNLHTISFALDKNSCMGIFGTRHCSKTHLVKQIIGEDSFSFGDVYLQGIDLKDNLTEAYQNINYCPQYFGLFMAFTPRELFRLICMIHGYNSEQTDDAIRDVANNLDLRRLMNKKIGRLRYESQRKVNIGLALVIYGPIILIDEPTRGLPAHTCREIWNVLRFMRYCGKTIIFTSTNTLECETLADYNIICDEGEMLAIGSIHYLRIKFTRGFYLEVRIKRDGATAAEAEANFFQDCENLHRFISWMHGESELRMRIDNWLKFYLPVKVVTYSYIFGAMEKNARRLNITDYNVSQGTMEDVMRNIEKKRPHSRKLPSFIK